ncbi:uncharacterized protein LOC105011166 [Esox lucius]|uniref:uncharacterized protein LOC105011166 n=1 Tax=Esox lucius TaxID=8010 RepID=UPI00147705E8|nr:uncharacterized protein LOC105011166 [Esox lucius]XP_034148986.1 uncharacterized protein LOC105011166 [Esox lucius]
MDRTVFLLLLFTGLSVLPPCLSVQYHFIAEPGTLTDAQSNCTQNYTGLGTAENMREIDMFNIVTAHWKETTWLEPGNGTWRWSLDGTELKGEGFWEHKQPDFQDNNEFCVFVEAEKWHDEQCDKIHSFVCYDEHNHPNEYIHIVNLQKKWAESQQYCRQNHTDLAIVRNSAEWEKVKNISLSSNNNSVWIGLRKLPCVWGWSNNTGSCSMDNVNRGPANENKCPEKRPFICYDDELVLVNENKTWSEALWSCRDKGMELVSVLNQNIQNWVQQRADNASSPFVWLGLRYSCTLNFWFWVSGNYSCYQNWADGQGHNTEQCEITGAIKTDGGHWSSLPETDRHNFICSKSHDY